MYDEKASNKSKFFNIVWFDSTIADSIKSDLGKSSNHINMVDANNNTHAELMHAGFNVYRLKPESDELPKLLKKMKARYDKLSPKLKEKLMKNR